MKKILLLFTAALLLLFVSCEKPPEDTAYKVMVVEKEGLDISSENPKSVKHGENAVFNITVSDNYVVRSVSAGVYDRERGRLTIENVTADTRVSFELLRVDYDATEKVKFYFSGSVHDTSTISPLSEVYYGTDVSLCANDRDRVFVGWTVGASAKDGAVIISPLREYTLMLTPDMADDGGRVIIYANYTDAISYKYDLNGGAINRGGENYIGNSYYTTEYSEGILTVTLSSEYSKKTDAACLFWDDGTFSREGYILREYNTKSDGTGEAYSLGSKYYVDRSKDAPTLYCIWEKQTNEALFEVRDFEFVMPSGTNIDKAPHWIENGVIITKYKGISDKVVIPEKIGGKYVTAIATGAFTDKNIKTLVMGKHILKIEKNAFRGCTKLETIYYPDGIYSIGNDSFDAASYTSLKHLYVNATIAPRYSETKDGGFARKLVKLMSTMGENRIIAVGGSSVYQGLATAYLEALLEDYAVINFGTTRTTNGLIYYEALCAYTHSGDVVLISPENSIYMMGEGELYYKTLRDIEGMYNLFRYIDISNYTNVFGAFAEFNSVSSDGRRYARTPNAYEDFIVDTDINLDGDCVKAGRDEYASESYDPKYEVTFDKFVKGADEKGPNENGSSVDFTLGEYADKMNAAITKIKQTGALVYFAFAPVDADAVSESARDAAALLSYDELILSTYTALDGILGTSAEYVFARQYFFDSAYHLNDYGRAIRTWRVYRDLAELLGIEKIKGIFDEGKRIVGCCFESTEEPKYSVDYLN